MKIIVTGSETIGHQSDAKLFNTVKRFQEDLLRRLPELKEFKLAVVQQGGPTGYLLGNTRYSHLLNDDETHLVLTCFYRNLPPIDLLENELTGQLKALLQIY